MAQIRQVVSETLQATVRRLLPSQRGFTEDLQASNVIFPVIDLTPAAEGSSVAQDLQTAISNDDQSAFDSNGGTVVVANTSGFWRIFGSASVVAGTVAQSALFQTTDGLSTKTIWGLKIIPFASGTQAYASQYDFVVWLQSGESISAVTTSQSFLTGSARNIADTNGVFKNPTGFSPQ